MSKAKEEKVMSVTSFASAAAAKKALGVLIEDIYNSAKGEAQKRIKQWKTKNKIDNLYTKAKNVRKVKTIWQVEKEVDLQKFYCPSKIICDKKRITINHLDDFSYGGNVVVQGTVGQGKSIFFRYLTAMELAKGSAIPLFIELRRIRPKQTLKEHLLDELKSLGLDVDLSTFSFLAEQGKLILFLDAFDEVKESQRTTLIDEIEHMAKRYDDLRIFISSRPDSGIAHSPFFRVFELAALKGNEYQYVIQKAAHNSKISDEIVSLVQQSTIAHLLTTPLMVALLMFRYRAEQSIPENSTAFYDGLFTLLMQRHDKSKAGYVRPRKSKLSDMAILGVFNALCYLTRKSAESSFSFNELVEYVKKAAQIVDADGAPDLVLSDIIEVTCLVLEEGGECKFIHKNVQEYHAACFIKSQPDSSAEKFYRAMVQRRYAWEQELHFLSNMDTYRFMKWFFIPDSKKMSPYIGIRNMKEWKKKATKIISDIGNISLHIDWNDFKANGFTFDLTSIWWFSRSENFWKVFNKLEKLDFHLVESVLIEKGFWSPAVDNESKERFIALTDLVENDCAVEKIKQAFDDCFSELQAKILEAEAYVKRIEDNKEVFDF